MGEQGGVSLYRTNRPTYGFLGWNRPALLALVPLTVGATCSPSIEPQALYNDGAGNYDPPSSYAAWWYEVEQCTGKRGYFRAITWYVVPTEQAGFRCNDPRNCDGLYLPTPHAIYMADSKVDSKQKVKHEMAHALGLSHINPDLWRCSGQSMPDEFKPKRRGGT